MLAKCFIGELLSSSLKNLSVIMLTPKFLDKHISFLLLFLLSVAFFIGAFAFYLVFFVVPDDYLQGSLVKIMYVHVPVSWLGLAFYCAASLFSLLYLSIKNPFYSMVAQAILPVGLVMTIISLATGSIWGKPAWGTWWVWDARLTSMLILMFIYLACIVLSKSFANEERAAGACAIFMLVGLINIPIIKFSVNIWHTLHQPSSVLRWGAPTIHSSMLYPLLVMFTAIACLTAVPIILNLKAAILRRKLIRLSL